jgi:hypothetical protein
VEKIDDSLNKIGVILLILIIIGSVLLFTNLRIVGYAILSIDLATATGIEYAQALVKKELGDESRYKGKVFLAVFFFGVSIAWMITLISNVKP